MVSPGAEAWLVRLLEDDAFPEAVDRTLSGATTRLLDPSHTLRDLLPDAGRRAVERAIASYLPVAVHRLGRVLEDPSTRAQVERVFQDLLQQMLRDLKLHQRLVARLVMTDDAVDRMVDTIQSEGAEQLARMLQEPELQASLARGIQAGIEELLEKPVTEILGQADDPGVVEVRRNAAQWLVRLARTGSGDGAEGSLAAAIPADRVAQGIVHVARSEAGTAFVRDTLRPWILSLVHQPLGTPARWLGDGGGARLSAAVRDPLWEWLQAQVPHFLARLDIQKRVEDKVLSYPTEELESLVRRVTDRELRLIIRLGYVLGGMIGGLLVLIHRLLPGG
jgi:uncharacterized membrane protein YheB (UPF0754 family)